MKISISDKMRELFPELKVVALECNAQNSPTNDELWELLEKESAVIKSRFRLEDINQIHQISTTRKAYKKLGKDPNRYRPSAEALCRRIIREIPLYRLSTLVDIVNIISIKSGISIGGFDKDKICGEVELGAGTSNDEFDAIGRGILNVEGLPIYRDATGGIGTPTSDNERTKITGNTQHVLLIFNGYGGNEGLNDAIGHAKQLLSRYAAASNFYISEI